ncbi:MAG: phosphate acetyltransferase [Gammaproteobacteria bacterium]|nr:phosphate acetyltransferase [Gammaproteobacteria bacterium]MBT4147363.1 phosphate acetyltransferase [Gammaproteobacteria bacterium]MBT5221744.1 phosphate acetyltransferase [Gammaproteobacteria bacterium]MBT5826446.1 phosphate acetyltransferase [Gammaproteobacteria bacterium]MBT5967011.1 phosphate acetyltransferase [Gammaproteobacteria bacterium]
MNKQNIYVTGAEQGSGKSIIMLAMMDMLSGYAGKIGFFRPIINDSESKDELIQLIRHRYRIDFPYESMYGCQLEEAQDLINRDKYNELLTRILIKFRTLSAQCDNVLCLGPNYVGDDSIFEFDFNAEVANNLGCLIMPVVQGRGRENYQIIDAVNRLRHALLESGCDLFSIIINGVEASQVEELRIRYSHQPHSTFPVYVVPSEPSLNMLSVGNISRQLDARILSGDQQTLNRAVNHFKIAAMQVPDFLEHLEEGALIITPSDRADIILACLMSYPSTNYPQIAGLLLTGKQNPPTQVINLIAGLGDTPFTVLSVEHDTFTTAMQITNVRSRLYSQDETKIATALGLMENNLNFDELCQRLTNNHSERVTPLMFEYEQIQRAKANIQHIVLPEGDEERILRAAEILLLRNIVHITLLGDVEVIQQKITSLGLQLDDIIIIDPLKSELRELYAKAYFKLRKEKGVTYDMAYDIMSDVSYFGVMMVHLNHADGMVSGAVHTTQHTIRPAFQIIKTKPGVSIVSSVFFMCLEDRVLVYSDCAVNSNPDAQELADIAVSAAQTAMMYNISPRVAMLSYSTGESGKGEAVNKVRQAVAIAQREHPEFKIEGPMQYDAAIDAGVARTKLPDSKVAGQANVFVFPDLNTGNTTYKAVQRSSGAIAIGPILQGLNKPVNDLSRGCTVTDIVNTVVMTAIQSQSEN